MSEAEYKRVLRLPLMLANARRKLAALEAEARRRGMHELLPESEA